MILHFLMLHHRLLVIYFVISLLLVIAYLRDVWDVEYPWSWFHVLSSVMLLVLFGPLMALLVGMRELMRKRF